MEVHVDGLSFSELRNVLLAIGIENVGFSGDEDTWELRVVELCPCRCWQLCVACLQQNPQAHVKVGDFEFHGLLDLLDRSPAPPVCTCERAFGALD